MSTLPENITLINQIKNISKEWITVSFVNSETGSIEPHHEAVFRVKNEKKGSNRRIFQSIYTSGILRTQTIR